jgi:hypothetical protein
MNQFTEASYQIQEEEKEMKRKKNHGCLMSGQSRVLTIFRFSVDACSLFVFC